MLFSRCTVKSVSIYLYARSHNRITNLRQKEMVCERAYTNAVQCAIVRQEGNARMIVTHTAQMIIALLR